MRRSTGSISGKKLRISDSGEQADLDLAGILSYNGPGITDEISKCKVCRVLPGL